MNISTLEQKIYNKRERLLPGITHDIKELIRHRSSYIFFKNAIEYDIEKGTVPQPVRIVDLGCGVGHGCHILSKIPDARIVGVDVSPESLEYARNKYSNENIAYQLADLNEFISTMTEYDYVVSRCIIEHIKNGLDIILATKWRQRLLFDVPYDEPAGNPHHLLTGIREKHLTNFPDAELFYEDIDGSIYDISNKPSKPNMIMCVCSQPNLKPLSTNNLLVFPVPAWHPDEGIKEGYNIRWIEREELFPLVIKKLQSTDVILDIGSGIMPQKFIRPLIHICCDPFAQYVEHLQRKTQNVVDRLYLVIKASWKDVIDKFTDNSVDTIFLIDVVEHLEKEEGMHLLNLTERIARNQVVLFTPLGFMPQEYSEQIDAWGLDGGAWQEHKSGWSPKDFDDSWNIYACEDYHLLDNSGVPFTKPFGAFWAIKNISPATYDSLEAVDDYNSKLDDVVLCLEGMGVETNRDTLTSILFQKYKLLAEAHQQLQDSHKQLKKSRMILLRNELEKYPSLMNIIIKLYNKLVKIYRFARRNN